MPAVMPKSVLNMLIKTIGEASHMLTDEIGAPIRFGTLGEKELRTAALTALTIATGEPIWPGDRQFVIPDQPKQVGIFRFER
jgi:hypothetical protein